MTSKVDVAHNFTEANLIESARVPIQLADGVAIVAMFFCVLSAKSALWIWQRLILGLHTPSKNFSPKSILIYLQGMVGDVSVHLPAILAIRMHYPGVPLTCVCYSEGFPIQPLLEGLPYIDKLIVIKEQPVQRNGLQLELSTSTLHGLSADLFVNFSPFANRGVPGFVAREMAFAHKCGAKAYLGGYLSTYGVPLFLKRARRFFVRNEPRRGWKILEPLGICPIRDVGVAFSSRAVSPMGANKFHTLDPLKPYAVINPGAKYVVQRWPAEYYGKVAVYLAEKYGLQVIVTGSKGEFDIGEEVFAASRGTAFNACGLTSLPELIEILRFAKIVMTNDTGPMHLATLLNRPTVAIFGTRQSVRHWFPVGNHVAILLHYHEHSFSYDDEGKVSHCLEAIAVADVCSEVDDLLTKQQIEFDMQMKNQHAETHNESMSCKFGA